MSLPCIKFISHFASYLTFIVLIIATNLGFSYEESELKKNKFSQKYELFKQNYSSYIHNDKLDPPKFKDFCIRPDHPSGLDVVITIWIIGNLKIIFNLKIKYYS